MLPKEYCELDAGACVRIRRYTKDEKGGVSCGGAFPFGVSVVFQVEVSRQLGCAAVVLRIRRDGGEARDLCLRFDGTECGTDTYTLTLDTSDLCRDTQSACSDTPDADPGTRCGLFFYEFLFVRGWNTLFSDSVNNEDFHLRAHAANPFRLLVHEPDFHTPEWFRGATIYHVFVDRFYKGEGKVGTRADAEIHPDWENGVPQYAEKQGDPLKNNLFFGGNLWGVAQKLDFLTSLGVTVIYLSPIFKAYSNHKYDTGDYETVDEMFGGEEALTHLIREADARGIRIILDGVFNHTGDDSKYFNRNGTYPTLGAYQSPDSPYHDWYCFHDFPDSYESWWGIGILPKLNPACEDCRRYFTGEDGIIAKYLKMGISGWRLDVADELSDAFLDELRATAKSVSPESEIIGEVWENAVEKIAYGHRRRYFSGRQLDSVMNYPIRSGILSFVMMGDADALYHVLTELYATYPREVSDSLMNLLGTHDTERILTVLGAVPEDYGLPCASLAHKRLSPEQREKAIRLLKIASAIQFTVFGVPSVYYGDEAGVEGYHDPFCRMPYPWGRENRELLVHYQHLGEIRRDPAFDGGDFSWIGHGAGWIAYERRAVCHGNSTVSHAGTGSDEADSPASVIAVLANRSSETVNLPAEGTYTDLLTGDRTDGSLFAEPDCARIWKRM